MRTAARAIIIKDGAILTMHRNKFGHEYDILIGGGVDFGENHQQTLQRELREESGVTMQNPRLVFVENAGDIYGMQYVYLCEYVGGEPELNPESDEYAINAMGQNLYQPRWLPLTELPNMPFRSESLKRAILKGASKGWPTDAVDITAM